MWAPWVFRAAYFFGSAALNADPVSNVRKTSFPVFQGDFEARPRRHMTPAVSRTVARLSFEARLREPGSSRQSRGVVSPLELKLT